MENTILTDEQIKEISETIEDSKNETDALMEQIEKEHENEDNSNFPLEEGEAEFIKDGILMEVNDDEDDDFNHFENIDASIDELIENTVKDSIMSNYELSDEETIKFANLITRVRRKEKFNVYDELPQIIKDQVNEMCNGQAVPLNQQKNYKRMAAKLLIDELISDAELDALSIDLEEAMKELIPAPMEMYSEFNKEYIEEEFVKVAEKIREENPKTADNLLSMRKGYIDAYTYEPMYEVFKNGKIQKNVRRANVVWSRINAEYLRLAGVCKFNLYSLDDLHANLMVLGYDETQARRILTLFVYTYTDGIEDYNDEEEYNDIYRNAFANYFEANIKNLAITPDLLTDFSKEIKDNLQKLSDHIETTIAEKEAELSNKKKNRKGD